MKEMINVGISGIIASDNNVTCDNFKIKKKCYFIKLGLTRAAYQNISETDFLDVMSLFKISYKFESFCMHWMGDQSYRNIAN